MARWENLSQVFEQALLLTPEKRGAFLDASCPDPAARADVEALLEAHGRRGVLDVLAEDVMAPLLAQSGPKINEAVTPAVMDSRFRILERLGGGGHGRRVPRP